MTQTNGKRPALSSIRICDFTGQLAGAGATKVLAMFGAQVIRVEDRLRQGQWDIFRGNGPWMDERRGINLGGTFNNHNVEKMGVTLDMRKPEASGILRELISVSDVVAENFSKGVLDRWGFSYDEMVKIKPDIIYVSNCGFGHVGPYSEYKTWGPIVQAVSGLTFQSGLAEMPPAGWGYSFMDHTGGYHMAIAILMAVYHRNRTGVGQWVDMSCSDGAAALNGPAVLDYTVNGVPARRPGNPDSNRSIYPRMAPHGIYKCAGEDQWAAVAVRNDDDWTALCETMGLSDLASDESLKSVEGRINRHDELDERIQNWTESRNPMQVMELLQSRGVPAAAVQHPEDRIERDPNTKAWGLFPTVEHAEMGSARVDGMAVALSETPATIEKGAPTLGQHNSDVYGDILGMSTDTVLELTDEGVI